MFHDEFQLGGPVMYVLFAVWVLMFALILERSLFWFLRPWQRGRDTWGAFNGGGDARAKVAALAEHNLWRIDALAQLATSLGLFGTVVGIARSFFARGHDLGLAAPEVLASGLATALFTTVAGLAAFLVGQGALFAFHWLADRELRRVEALV